MAASSHDEKLNSIRSVTPDSRVVLWQPSNATEMKERISRFRSQDPIIGLVILGFTSFICIL